MSKFKVRARTTTVAAIILAIIGTSAFVGWEAWGREAIMYQDVIVASQDIYKGDNIKEGMLASMRVPRETVVPDFLDGKIIKTNDEETIAKLEEKVANQYIPKNAQINKKMLSDVNFYVKANQSVYYIPKTWIYSISTSVRRGDMVEFRSADGSISYGKYMVAFAKSDDEVEVVDTTKTSDGLGRVSSEGVVTHIEIICTIKQYEALYSNAIGKQVTLDNKGSDIVNQYVIVQSYEE